MSGVLLISCGQKCGLVGSEFRIIARPGLQKFSLECMAIDLAHLANRCPSGTNPTNTLTPSKLSSASRPTTTLRVFWRIALIVESSSYHPTISAMASPEVHQLFHNPIADHSFSADKQTLAVARDTRVELYGRSGNGFKLKDELKGHDKTVTGVDVALHSGRIVTCSQGMPQPSRCVSSCLT
jgi:hypothetical protein